MKYLYCLFCCRLKFKVCGVVSCSSFCICLNHFVLLLLCLAFASAMCCWDVLIKTITKVMDLTLPTLFQFASKNLTSPEPGCCFICVWVFGVCPPLVVLHVKPLSAFLMFLYACVGCVIVFYLKVNWSACQLTQCNLCFAFWKLFWCSTSVAMFYCFCLNVHAFLCVPLHSVLSRSIFSVVYLLYKLIVSAEDVFCFAWKK